MTEYHDIGRKKPARVSETMPVQVFLGHQDRDLLERLTTQLNATKSEVLRRGMAALERLLMNPETHPALSIVGLVDGDTGIDKGVDVAVHHDRVLADTYEKANRAAKPRRRGQP